MGVRYADQEWKRELNRTIGENQPAINKLLLSFGVPLLDDDDRAITEDSVANEWVAALAQRLRDVET